MRILVCSLCFFIFISPVYSQLLSFSNDLNYISGEILDKIPDNQVKNIEKKSGENLTSCPTITGGSTINPVNCATPNGTLILYGLTPNTSYAVEYIRNSDAPTIITIISTANGEIKISPLPPGSYHDISVTLGGCVSNIVGPFLLVEAFPLPLPGAVNNSPLCSGSTLNLIGSTTLTQNVAYSWVGPNGFTSSLQNITIPNVTVASAGVYRLIVFSNGCGTGAVTTYVNITQTPTNPAVISSSPLCVGSTLLLNAENIAGASYNWTGPNGFASYLQNPVINNVTVANAGNYNVIVTINNCQSPSSTVPVIISPVATTPVINTNSPICEGNTLNLNSPYIAGISYAWAGPNGFTSSLQNPVINNISALNAGVYTLTLTGCNVSSNTTIFTVNPAPLPPSAYNNGPLCMGQTLSLTASAIAGSAYTWTGPNGFTSSLQNPVINNSTVANTGMYNVSVMVNGCNSTIGVTSVAIADSARANAGSDQIVCANNSVVNLSGGITGGSISGLWSSSGTGTFSPDNASLNVIYNLTNTDKQAGNVKLTLTSINNGVCPASSSSVFITLPTAVTVNAGADQKICSNTNSINLNGQVTGSSAAIWTTSGGGTFSPNNITLNALYFPSASDKTKGSVTLKLASFANGNCPAAFDESMLTINAGPNVNAGPDRVIIENDKIILQPVITGTNLKYLWTPNLYISSDTAKNPVLTGINDQIYTLSVSDIDGCTNSDAVNIIVLRVPVIPNTFSPNNDGINDTWIIKNLQNYPDSKVQIFNRYGQVVFESKGYVKAWDGTLKGKPLPFGTYYYVIEPGNGVKPFTGYITLIK